MSQHTQREVPPSTALLIIQFTERSCKHVMIEMKKDAVELLIILQISTFLCYSLYGHVALLA